jgi:hypothetical protein
MMGDGVARGVICEEADAEADILSIRTEGTLFSFESNQNKDESRSTKISCVVGGQNSRGLSWIDIRDTQIKIFFL